MSEHEPVRESLKRDESVITDVRSILRLAWREWPEDRIACRAAEIAGSPDPGLTLRLEAQFAWMQTPASRAATDAALRADSVAMGRVAVEAAQRERAAGRNCVVCGTYPATIRLRVHPLLGDLWVCGDHAPEAAAVR